MRKTAAASEGELQPARETEPRPRPSDADANPDAPARLTDAQARAEQAEARALQAEARAEQAEARLAEAEARWTEAEARANDLDERSRELENEVAYRGVKLSCARIALTRAKMAFDDCTRHREQMIQDVAHDLRTPLTSIKGACQNLLDGVAGPLGEDVREYVEIVGEHSERLIGAVNWLLEAMRVSNEPLDVHSADIDLGELTDSVIHSLRPIAEERGIALSVETEPAPARVDPGKIRKVIENIVGNALKFTGEGGSVQVSLTRSDSDVFLRVQDTGVGIGEEELGRIFERYYRKSSAGSHSSGLGLVICREIVRLHGGEIEVDSELGKGSVFRVRIPQDGETLNAWVTHAG